MVISVFFFFLLLLSFNARGTLTCQSHSDVCMRSSADLISIQNDSQLISVAALGNRRTAVKTYSDILSNYVLNQ